MNSTWLSVLLVLVLPVARLAGQSASLPRRAPVVLTAPTQDKNFYLLSLIERSSEAAKAIEVDESLRRIAATKRGAPAKEAQPCTPDPACFTGQLRFTEEEIADASSALRRLYRTSAPVLRMIDGPLRQRGIYVRRPGQPGGE